MSSSVLPWVLLVVAGLFEIVWAISLKASDGWTRLGPSAITLAAMAVSFWLLSLAMKALPVGTAYSVWVGIGAAGAAVLGMVLFGESAAPARLACIGLIVAGVIGLKILG